jgi:uncharacterized protein (TIGR02996 family)
MTVDDALLAAICAEPDEDTPRLALADWLEEEGQIERAAFIRTQVELARTPLWEPFAVAFRWRKSDWVSGRPFRDSLPPVDGHGVEWHENAFRRGLGWRLNIRSLVAWEKTEPIVLGRAPVGEVDLWHAATLDDWRRFAASQVVPRLRKVHFVASPIEPLRVLRDTPAALGITDIYLERASGPGMPFVVEDLLRSPLGQIVRGLHFYMGHEAIDDLIEALSRAKNLERLSLDVMGLVGDNMRHLLEAIPEWSLREIDIRGNPLGSDAWELIYTLPESTHTLGLAETRLTGQASRALANLCNLRRLDLSRNRLPPRLVHVLSRWPWLAGLRSLNMNRCGLTGRELFWFTHAPFWPNLVELDLRENPITGVGVRHLLDAALPPDLTALVLTGDTLHSDARAELHNKYAERVVFAASEVVGL